MNSKSETTNNSANSPEMNTSELNAFGQNSRIPRSPVWNREMNPFGKNTRTPRFQANVGSSELVVLGSE